MISAALVFAACLHFQVVYGAGFSQPSVIRETEAEYSYNPSSSIGPSLWGDIQESFRSCSSGGAQSGINYPCKSSKSVRLRKSGRPFVFSASNATFIFSRTTSNWALNCETPGTCGFTAFKGKAFSVINMHFHSPSEHMFNGMQYPLEAHVVHQAPDGTLLVIGVLFSDGAQDDCLTFTERNKGKPHQALQDILMGVEAEQEKFVVNVKNFIRGKGFLQYDGSLTTPPCSEGVTWVSARRRQNVVSTQVELYEKTAGSVEFGNSRPLQAMNGRRINLFSARS